MIVVCGDLEPAGRHAALAVAVAAAAARAGAKVEAVGIIGDGTVGDRRLIELANATVGHAAVLRTPTRALEPADVDLALRYLPDVRVLVAANPGTGLIPALIDGAAYTGATFVLIAGVDSATVPNDLPDSAIVMEAPADDPEGTFAGFVGAFAARLDGGSVPADAWAATVRDLAVDPVTEGPGRRGRAPAR